MNRAIGFIVAIGLLVQLGIANSAHAQSSYSDYYNRNVSEYQRPRTSAREFTFDRMYKNNSAISPYINLVRRQGQGLPNYQKYVVPEVNRRARNDQRNLTGRQTSSQSYQSTRGAVPRNKATTIQIRPTQSLPTSRTAKRSVPRSSTSQSRSRNSSSYNSTPYMKMYSGRR